MLESGKAKLGARRPERFWPGALWPGVLWQRTTVASAVRKISSFCTFIRKILDRCKRGFGSQGAQGFLVGLPGDAVFADDRGYIARRGDVEGRILDGDIFGRDRDAEHMGDLARRTLLDRYLVAGSERQVERGDGRRY